MKDVEIDKDGDAEKGFVVKISEVLSSIVGMKWDSLVTRLINILQFRKLDIDKLKCCIKGKMRDNRTEKKNFAQVAVENGLQFLVHRKKI